MKTAYFNCSSGIAGDMTIAAFINAGLPARELETHLKKALKLAGWNLETTVTERYHFPAAVLTVKGDRNFKDPGEMKRVIAGSGLPERVKKRSLRILDTLIRAESLVHRVQPGKVHFHELNSIDTLIDVAGSCLAVEMLGIEQVYASALNIGRGAPATLQIVKAKNIPVYATTGRYELATPTGTAVIAELAQSFGAMPLMTIETHGIGAGMQVIPEHRNILTVSIGRTREARAASDYLQDAVALLETNIDDMDPRIYPYVLEKLLAAGAKDAWLTQVLMKKGRPGIVLSVLCSPEQEGEMAAILFDETTTLGVRRTQYSRYTLKRTETKSRKIAHLSGGRTRAKAEFRHALQKAVKTSRPLKDILY